MEKKKVGIKNLLVAVGFALLAYVVIFLIAALFASLRLKRQNTEQDFGWWEITQVGLFPLFFFISGYIVTKRLDYVRMRAGFVIIFALVFSGALFALWYASLPASAILNMPAAQGGFAIDHSLRKQVVEVEGEILYRAETDQYKYFALPFIYFLLDLFYWFCYYFGNVICTRKNKKK